VAIECHFPADEDVFISLNIPLFEWVIENLCKNAIDAMDGIGRIDITIIKRNDEVLIDVKDTGKGIDKSKYKVVFTPGFTTKKRGWGLGLSLAKRIIEEYHGGKIFVKHSELNIGTTFRIQLKVNSAV
jgi:signal transduction histidine kinase